MPGHKVKRDSRAVVKPVGAHDHPRSQQPPHLKEALAAMDKVILRSIHQLRLRQGEGKVALDSDHKIQGEEPLAKES